MFFLISSWQIPQYARNIAMVNEVEALERLRDELEMAETIHDKIAILNDLPAVQKFIDQSRHLRIFLANLAPECECAFKQLIAIGQAERLFRGLDESNFRAEHLRDLIEKIIHVDQFYRELGGIAGYQAKIRGLLEGGKPSEHSASAIYHSPQFHNISEETESVQETIFWGIESLPEMAEMYPLGGAADRLHLVDKKTGLELPAAKLCFAGRTLLENLIRDLQAREYLYFKIYGQQLTTPIAIMTSHEKENHFHVVQICIDSHWFRRPKDSFRFFTQPLVPAVNECGDWCLLGPLKPILKPGGHGAIWKLARDEGIFAWFEKLGRKKALIRQINNPLAGLDYGLLAFIGYGWKRDMIFGFASCPRLLQAAEGVNVVIERKKETGTDLVLTNIEYCDFTKFGIQDLPMKEGEPFSRFSSNTNILFIDLKEVIKAIDSCPFPGLLINLKRASYLTEAGEKIEEPMARLESTMQNIADVFVEEKPISSPPVTTRTFVTYNHRHKTISTAKKAFAPGRPLQETPENCFFDLLSAHRELLQKYCGFTVPHPRTAEEYLKSGPDFLFLYHPALGPLYSLIRQKLRGGKLSLGAELVLEIAEMQAMDLEVEGSLQVIAEQIIGHLDPGGILHYSNRIGQCILENVAVRNLGVDWDLSHPFWKMDLKRRESLKIILKGRSLFSAKNVTFEGDMAFVVEDGVEMRVFEKSGKMIVEEIPLEK